MVGIFAAFAGGFILLGMLAWYWSWAPRVWPITSYPNIDGSLVTLGVIAGIFGVSAVARSKLVPMLGEALGTLTKRFVRLALAVLLLVSVGCGCIGLVAWLFAK